MLARSLSLATLVAASLVLTSCAAEDQKGDPRATPMAIDAQNRAWMRAVKRGDAASVSSIYADSATLFAPSTDVIVGRPAIQSFFKSATDGGLKEMRLTTVNVLVSGRLAREIGRYTATFQSATAKAPTLDKGKYIAVWTRQADGTWKIESDIWNSGGVGAAPPKSDSAKSDTAAAH